MKKMYDKKMIRGAKQTNIMHKSIGPRKSPKQDRSKERYQKILEVTFETIDEVGYENTTTDIIAERCRISVGSLYQFFPNKETIVFTYAEILYIQLHDLFFQKIWQLEKKYRKYSEGLIQEILFAFESSMEEVSAYQTLHSILYTHPSLLKLDYKSNERFAKSLVTELLLPLFPKLSKSRALVLSKITVESVDAVYRSLLRNKKNSKSKKEQIVQELERFLHAYWKTIQ
jgi:AcrR family transcriptional regulator